MRRLTRFCVLLAPVLLTACDGLGDDPAWRIVELPGAAGGELCAVDAADNSGVWAAAADGRVWYSDGGDWLPRGLAVEDGWVLTDIAALPGGCAAATLSDGQYLGALWEYDPSTGWSVVELPGRVLWLTAVEADAEGRSAAVGWYGHIWLREPGADWRLVYTDLRDCWRGVDLSGERILAVGDDEADDGRFLILEEDLEGTKYPLGDYGVAAGALLGDGAWLVDRDHNLHFFDEVGGDLATLYRSANPLYGVCAVGRDNCWVCGAYGELSRVDRDGATPELLPVDGHVRDLFCDEAGRPRWLVTDDHLLGFF
ncbi:MAG: hypothetical protein GF399_07605 [Candidatus Coatesbacteria bacterium]|nr:hypothetical protein [Candidatus Coatesbacteria bacterium]